MYIGKTERKVPKKNIVSTEEEIDCPISKASTEIMLNRFYNGNELDFPFRN